MADQWLEDTNMNLGEGTDFQRHKPNAYVSEFMHEEEDSSTFGAGCVALCRRRFYVESNGEERRGTLQFELGLDFLISFSFKKNINVS